MKKIVPLLLCVLMLAASFVGCTPKKPTPPDKPVVTEKPDQTDQPDQTKEPGQSVDTEKYQETITFVPHYQFKTTDPQNTSAATDLSMYLLVYNNLVKFDSVENKIVPDLAESWEWATPTVLEMKLREDVKFHNGADFTAEDVEFTFKRGKEQGGSKSKLKSLDHVEIVGPYEIKLVLTAPNVDFLYMLTDGRTSMLSKKAFDELPEQEACKIGSGPYKWDEWVMGDHVTLVRNDEHWGELPKTKKFIIREIPEQAARLIALKNGEVDIIAQPAPNDLHYISEDPSLRLMPFLSSGLRSFALNTIAKYTNDVKVRQAIAYGINREEYNTVAYNGNAVVINNMMHPSYGFCKEINAIEYNPEKAKQILADAGYKEGEITLEMLGTNNTNDANFATLFQAQMKAIGINVNFHPEENTAFGADRSGGDKFNVVVETWAGYTVGPDNSFRMIFYSDAPYNKPNIHDEYVDSTLDEAVQTEDEAKRMELYGALEQYINDQAYEIPIVVEPNPVAMKASLEGFVPPKGLVYDLINCCIPIP